jgi:dTDP-glucose pyrophosphorylase
MIKKVVIAAAGYGTRMLQLTKNKPKHLIYVQNHPFLYYLLANLKKAGLKEMILVVGYQKEAMEEFQEKYKKEFPLTIIDQFAIFGKEKYGTAIPLWCVKEIIGKENFLMVFGDNLYSPKDISSLLINDDYHYISVIPNPHPEKYGVVVTQGELLVKIVEKPKIFISNLVNTGLHKFTPEIFEFAEKITPSLNGEYILTDAIHLLAQNQRVKVKLISDYWLDFGNPGDILKMWKFLEKNKTL